MTGKIKPPQDYQNIDPDDFENYEEGYVKKGGGGGSGARSGDRKGKKTIDALKKQQRSQSREQRRSDLEISLKEVLTRLLPLENPELREKRLDQYITWIVDNIKEMAPLNPSEIKITFSKSGGPGGQNVNKRETKVALVHLPTLLHAESDQTRSQLQNKNLALELLQERLQSHLHDWMEYLSPGQIVDLELIKTLLDREN